MNKQHRGKLMVASCIIKTRCEETGQSIEEVLNEGCPYSENEWNDLKIDEIKDFINSGGIEKILNNPEAVNEMTTLIETHKRLLDSCHI